MNLENVSNYPQALIAIKPSKILTGKCGVFALRALKKGTTITRAEDFNESIFISWKEFTKLDRITQKRLKMFCAQYPEVYAGLKT